VIARLRPPLGAGAGRLAALHASAFAHDRGWSAAEFEALASGPGTAIHAGAEGVSIVRTVADEAELLTLAVAPAARRRGVGAALLHLAEAAAISAGAVRMILEVAEDNAAARALYAAAGYAAVGRRRAYYSRAGTAAADALILARPLAATPAAG